MRANELPGHTMSISNSKIKIPGSAADPIQENKPIDKLKKIYVRVEDYETFLTTEEALAVAGRIIATVECNIRNSGV